MKKSFTLVELMIVIAILAILSAIVIFALNPARLFDNIRDTSRVTDITAINKAIVFMESWSQSGINYGTTTNVYISLPDSNSNCSSYTLPTLPAGYSYYCSSPANYKKTDSTGWIPINFNVGANSYLTTLPVDPINNASYFYTYYTGGSYEVTALLANPNKNSINDEGSLTSTFEIGSPNRTFVTPLQRDKNLVAFWKFDEDSGNAQDYSGNGYTGTLSGPVRQTIAGTNKAMYYDGNSTDYISTPSFTIPNTGILTIETWMKSQLNATTYQSIFGDTSNSATIGFILSTRYVDDGMIYYYANGAIETYVYLPGIFQGFNNQWTHIVTVCDYANKTLKFYRNGVQFDVTKTLTGTPLFPSVNRAKYIGAYGPGQYELTDGSHDEFRIYNRGLSVEEISQHYNTTKAKFGL